MSDSIIYSTIPQYDVFVYGNVPGPLVCYLCNFGDMLDNRFEAERTLEMSDHLRAHLNKGDILPPGIFEEISRNSHAHYGNKGVRDK
jgi:hypothetical protein